MCFKKWVMQGYILLLTALVIPVLSVQNTAFTAANVNALMNKSAKELINSDKNDFSDPNNPKLSSIFKFYTEDLTRNGKTLAEFINQYADTKIAEKEEYSFITYDWSLNKQK